MFGCINAYSMDLSTAITITITVIINIIINIIFIKWEAMLLMHDEALACKHIHY